MPTFRFQSSEVADMEAAAQQVTRSIFPSSEVIEALTAKFNSAPERRGKYRVQSKQVLTWFHNRRYAPRTKEKARKLQAEFVQGETMLLRRQASSSSIRPSVQAAGSSGNRRMENGQFLGQIMPPPGIPVQRRSTPFQQGHCVDVHCHDLVLCLQECDGIPIHCEARVLATQRRTHEPSECDCKFLVCFEHDKTEVIVPLEKLRRPAADNDRVPTINCVLSTEADIVDLTSNEDNLGDEQENQANDGVGVLPAISPENCNASVSVVAIGKVEANVDIIEIDDD